MSEKQTDQETVSPRVAAIRALKAAGFTLIPLKGKIPAIRNWVEVAPDKYDEKNLPGNYGVVLGATTLVVDVDPRNFPKDDKPLKRLVSDLNIALKSFTVKTGGGGLHIYFRIPEGFKCVNDLPKYPGIEFKSAGRQVVGPGSIHPDTKLEYSILTGSPDIREDAPQVLLDLIKHQEPTTSEANAGTDTYKDDAGTLARFASYLKDTAELAVEGKNGDRTAFKVAAHGRDLGLAPQNTLDYMMAQWNDRCSPPWSHAELKAKVLNAYKYGKGAVGNAHPEADFTDIPMPPASSKKAAGGEELEWVMTPQGAVKVCFKNLLNHLKCPSTGVDKVFGYNEFTGRAEIVNPAPWHNGKMPRHPAVTDNDLKMLKAHLANNHGFEMQVTAIEEAVVVTAHANKFHPIREYLNGLKWDGVPRLDNWLRDFCGAADDEYTRAVARKIVCAAVMRVFKPGCKFDHAVVLEGEQGIGKSAVCAILGGEWSGDFTVDPHNKDTIQLMQGKWIIELAELEITRRSDSDALKAFLSRQVDTARLAYGRLASEFPRQSVFIATKNPGADGTYLKDDTGNRRWWPVALNPKGGLVDFKGLKDARNQIFAEAMMRVSAAGGERLDMETPELKNAAKEAAKVRHADHEWTERVAGWLETLPAERDFVTGRDIFLDAMGGVDKQLDRRSMMAIAGIMRALGWKSTVRRIGNRIVRGYSKIDYTEILGELA